VKKILQIKYNYLTLSCLIENLMNKFPFKIVDLTHTMHSDIPTWNGSCGFVHEIKLDYADREGDVGFRVQKIKMHAGVGTHIDAPSHCVSGGWTVDQIPLDDLVAPCVVIDVSDKMTPTYTLSSLDILAFEKRYESIKEDSFVIVYTGWEQYWNEPTKYRNELVFPSVSEEAANLLLERNIKGIGIDTISPDRPQDGFPVHRIILGSGKYIVENIANAYKLPPIGSFVIVAPIKGGGCTESPIRLIGLI